MGLLARALIGEISGTGRPASLTGEDEMLEAAVDPETLEDVEENEFVELPDADLDPLELTLVSETESPLDVLDVNENVDEP